MRYATKFPLVLLTLTVGCANMSTLQTAKTLAPSEGRVLVGGGYYASPDLDAEASDATGAEASLKMPYAEVGYRHGIVDDVEAGLKVTMPGTVAVDGKYQLLEQGGLALATGLGVGYLSLSSGEGADEVKSTILDVQVPLYASYDVGDYLAVYTSPKYLLRSVSGDGGSSLSHLAGATAGVKVGKDTGLFFEGTLMRDLSLGFNAVQVNGSLFF